MGGKGSTFSFSFSFVIFVILSFCHFVILSFCHFIAFIVAVSGERISYQESPQKGALTSSK